MTSSGNGAFDLERMARRAGVDRPTFGLDKGDRKHPRRILHVFGGMRRGGAEMRTLDVMRWIDRSRYQLHFCALSGLPGELDGDIEALGGQVHRLPLGPLFPLRFRALLRRERFDVVHSHVHYASGYVMRLAAAFGVPIRVTHFRNTSDGNRRTMARHAQQRILRRWIDRHATHILAVSEGAMRAGWSDDWEHDSRCHVVYNGLDLSRYQGTATRDAVRHEFGLPVASRLFVHVARMVTQKNHTRVVEIFGEIAAGDAHAYLLLVGRPSVDIERRIRKRIDQLQLHTRVIVAGERNDVPRLLRAANLLLLPSLWEGLPGVVLEASAVGLPVLASDLPGCREIARQCDSVRCLPLAACDQQWAIYARYLARPLISVASDDCVPASPLEGTEFEIGRCVRTLARIWDGEVPSVVPHSGASLVGEVAYRPPFPAHLAG